MNQNKSTRSIASACLSFAAFGLMAAFPANARADVSAEDAAMAKALFDRGRELLEAHRDAEACEVFAQSEKLDPHSGTMMNVAKCHEDTGKLASAWVEFSSIAAQARKEELACVSSSACDLIKERGEYAEKEMQTLAGRLSKVVMSVTAPVKDMKLTVDGKKLDVGVAGAGLPLDPGDHTVGATAPGKKDWSWSFTINAEQQVINVIIPALVDAPKEEIEGPKQSNGHHHQEASGHVSGWAVAGFTVGGVGLVLGGLSGIISLSVGSSVKSQCGVNGYPPNVCPPTARGKLSAANALANVSNVSLPIGVLGIVGGVVAFVFDKPSSKSDESAYRGSTSVFVGPASVGISGTF